ncbi:MAG TPA: SMP-30/gluconolactonase/LRE family protein [Dermatophilaceae bacterium]|nr:SMP-30/gluconolactonase/LRE family protein [Dermatophilaceae bacterium]
MPSSPVRPDAATRAAPGRLHVVPVPGPGAEDVLVGPDGRVWTGTADGSVLAVSPDGDTVSRVCRTGGRPLGLEWLPDGRLLVCDARRGLLAVDPANGAIEVLVDLVDGVPMRFCNNAAVSRDGTLWFTDSSREFGIDAWKDDLVAHTRSGRLLRRDPDGTVTTVLDGLAFANGVALAADESAVFVAETATCRVVRHDLRPTTTGLRTTPFARVPGHPDNLSLGTDGLVWVTVASPPNPVLGRLQRSSERVRRLALRIPERLKPRPERTVRVTAYRLDGTLAHDVSLDASSWHMATGVREHGGRVWLGSLEEPAVAWFDLRGSLS